MTGKPPINITPEPNEQPEHPHEKSPADQPAEGHTWVHDDKTGWKEVPMEIRTSDEEPFFPKDTPPADLPIDATPPKPSNPN